MQIVRTIIWVLILFVILAFSFFNWESVEVTLWDNLVLETKIPALVIIAFLLGLVPTWLYHRSVKWSLNRRIRSLESAAKSNALARRHEPVPPQAGDNPVENPAEDPAAPVDNFAPSPEPTTPATPATGDAGRE
ncbi:LapA family protein [Erythrobacter sp. JK5]|uniref:LapA family protein n=1 Tax=Erythrobacter sp. JK5 TaxID=2829500 RepID=UPI001BA8AAC4|nr:LapA family protein [Erythrobacter sp. JK5]QUL38475.1 LapA family protein [Erythrobacter sp. JK5]